MMFPLAPPDTDTQAALASAWARVDLARYLQRWAHTAAPAFPAGLTDYAWRALDVGCGFGKYLLMESELYPERGYLGIDKGTLRGGSMIERFHASGRANLFGIHGNVIPILAGFEDSLFDQISIFYPNPWWPAKHRKKRWSYHPLLPKLVRLLRPGGQLLLTSNEAFYLAEWAFTLSHHPAATELECAYQGPIQVTQGRTHFETKFLAEGTPCGEVRFRRAP